jgi:serine/threonine protein kinase
MWAYAFNVRGSLSSIIRRFCDLRLVSKRRSRTPEYPPLYMTELVLHGYEIGPAVGSGGMAKVYSAIQTSLQRPVAIKYLADNLIDHPEARPLFEQESVIVAQLNHPNIIQVFDKGIDELGHPYFVMEMVSGTSLFDLLRNGDITEQKKYDIAVQICRGLVCAHQNGIIHRDIKPANILIDEDGRVRLLDFGIAILRTGMSTQQPSTVIGTLRYSAPEIQRNAHDATLLSDIYSLGLVLLDLFTSNPDETKDAQSLLTNNQLSPELQSIIEDCLAESAADRPSSAGVVRDKLLKASAGHHLAAKQKQEASLDSEAIGKKFRLLDIIKKDEYGAVYLFQRNESNDLLIIKKRRKHLSGLKEARLLSSLKHPNIINIHGAAKNELNFITVMDYLPGGNLQQRLAHPWALGDFIFPAQQLCAALSFAHQNNIYHGNLRPANVLFDSDGNLQLTDFGVNTHHEKNHAREDWHHLIENEPPSITRDVFELGALFYQMLTAEPPSWTDGQLASPEIFSAQPEWLRDLTLSMLELDPAQRIFTVDIVLHQLQEQATTGHQQTSERAPGDKPTNLEAKQNTLGNNKFWWLKLAIAIVPVAILATYASLYFFFPEQFTALNETILSGLQS